MFYGRNLRRGAQRRLENSYASKRKHLNTPSSAYLNIKSNKWAEFGVALRTLTEEARKWFWRVLVAVVLIHPCSIVLCFVYVLFWCFFLQIFFVFFRNFLSFSDFFFDSWSIFLQITTSFFLQLWFVIYKICGKIFKKNNNKNKTKDNKRKPFIGIVKITYWKRT